MHNSNALNCICKTPASNLGRHTANPVGFHDFPQPLQKNAKIIPRLGPHRKTIVILLRACLFPRERVYEPLLINGLPNPDVLLYVARTAVNGVTA